MDRLTFLKALGLIPLMPMVNAAKVLDELSHQGTKSPRMPVVFLGHGSPMNALEINEFSKEWKKIGEQIPSPSAVLCISAHWLTRGTSITAMDQPPTLHDFGGFPKALSEVQYPAPGNPSLARETIQLIKHTQVVEDHDWGLDHGTWSVIRHLYPKADIPVLQLSIDFRREGSWHFELGAQLEKLRERGVLIVGSGNIVHNLRQADFSKINTLDFGYDWAKESSLLINQYLQSRRFEELCQYEKLGKAVQLAIPTPDHYYPLLYVLGLISPKEEFRLFNDRLVAGSLSMTSLISV